MLSLYLLSLFNECKHFSISNKHISSAMTWANNLLTWWFEPRWCDSRRKWQPTPVFLPGESHGQRSSGVLPYGIAQTQTWLKCLSSSSNSRCDSKVHIPNQFPSQIHFFKNLKSIANLTSKFLLNIVLNTLSV